MEWEIGLSPAEKIREVGMYTACVDTDGNGLNIDIENFGPYKEIEHGCFGSIKYQSYCN